MSLSTPRLLNAPGLRWTIGDVSDEGFEALRLSVWGAWKVFGARARYAVCWNSIAEEHARELTGCLPEAVEWIDATRLLPDWIRDRLDRGMAQGVGWKFSPLRVFADRYELALDNDCILWELPDALRVALNDTEPRCVIAEDVVACFGQFAHLCGPAPRNSGIRGVPSQFDLEHALSRTFATCDCVLRAETDEQGLQVAALAAKGTPLVVRTQEVSICSPFPPHSPTLGTCGAHFVGLNARDLGWRHGDRPASEVRREHWYALRDALYEKVGLQRPDLTFANATCAVLTDARR